MTRGHPAPRPARRLRGRLGLTVLLGLGLGLVLATGCGPVGSGGTGAAASFALGPVSGFGSVVVNGVHFDDDSASVLDADGHPLSARADLHLGSTLQILATSAGVSAVVAAQSIRVVPDLAGPVTSAFDPRVHQLQVLGQTVAIEPSTTFLDRVPGGTAGLAAGTGVEVSALYDANAGLYHATRIALAAPQSQAELRGAVSLVQGTAFKIGDQLIEAAGVALPPGFGPGAIVRVHLQLAPMAMGGWRATSIEDGVFLPPDGAIGSLRGAVDRVTDGRHAVVAGVPVDASTALMQPLHDIFVPGALVLVQGEMDGGRLIASRVDFRLPGSVGAGPGDTSGYGGTSFEIDGAIEASPNLDSGTFVMRGPTTVDDRGAVFLGGTAADLQAGRDVHVRGRLAPDGTVLVADVISFMQPTP